MSSLSWEAECHCSSLGQQNKRNSILPLSRPIIKNAHFEHGRIDLFHIWIHVLVNKTNVAFSSSCDCDSQNCTLRHFVLENMQHCCVYIGQFHCIQTGGFCFTCQIFCTLPCGWPATIVLSLSRSVGSTKCKQVSKHRRTLQGPTVPRVQLLLPAA